MMEIFHHDQRMAEIVSFPYSLYSSYEFLVDVALYGFCVVCSTYGGGVYLIFMVLCFVIVGMQAIYL